MWCGGQSPLVMRVAHRKLCLASPPSEEQSLRNHRDHALAAFVCAPMAAVRVAASQRGVRLSSDTVQCLCRADPSLELSDTSGARNAFGDKIAVSAHRRVTTISYESSGLATGNGSTSTQHLQDPRAHARVPACLKIHPLSHELSVSQSSDELQPDGSAPLSRMTTWTVTLAQHWRMSDKVCAVTGKLGRKRDVPCICVGDGPTPQYRDLSIAAPHSSGHEFAGQTEQPYRTAQRDAKAKISGRASPMSVALRAARWRRYAWAVLIMLACPQYGFQTGQGGACTRRWLKSATGARGGAHCCRLGRPCRHRRPR